MQSKVDKIMLTAITALAIVLIFIATISVIDHQTRSEQCYKQNGQMINTPRGTLCVLNLVTTNIPKN